MNEYFVSGIGWLDNESYDYEQKMSNLSAKVFYAKVEKINADYIDIDGGVGQMDMSKQDYDLMIEKTYAPENAKAYEAAKAKFEATIEPKPVKYYAVRQMNDRKLAVCISADNLVTVVKPHIAAVAEAKKTMTEIFKSRKQLCVVNLFTRRPFMKNLRSFKKSAKGAARSDISYLSEYRQGA